MKKIQILFLMLISGLVLAQTYDLKLNLKKGETYYMKQVSDMDIIQQGMSMVIKSTTNSSFKVEDKQKDTYKIALTYTYMSSDIDAMGQKMSYNSKMKESNEFSDFMKLMVGKTFYIYLTEKGKVTKVEGNDKIIAEIKEKGAGNPLLANDDIIGAYKTESIKQMFEGGAYNFPEKPVKVGDQWTSSPTIDMPYKMDTKSTYTLKGIEGDYLIVDVNSSMKTLPAQVIEANGMKMMPEVSGTNAGTIKLNKNTGWISDYTSNGDFTGNIVMMDMGDMKIDLKMKVNTKYTNDKE